MTPRDQAARDDARRRLDENVVVEAGAGTGKTTLLTDRILFLLLAGGPDKKGLALTEIVALTFTDKAAGEIQTRLSSRLEDVLAALDGRAPAAEDEAEREKRRAKAGELIGEAEKHFRRPRADLRRAAEAALQEMDRAVIDTIHGFAARLLRLYPVEAGVDPAFRVDKALEGFDELFEQEWARWLDGELGEEAPRTPRWLEALPLAALSDLKTLARALCGEEAAGAGFGPSDAMRKSFELLAKDFAALAAVRESAGGSEVPEAIEAVSAHLAALADSLGKDGKLPPSWTRKDFKKEKQKKWPAAWKKKGIAGAETYAAGAALAGETSAEAEALLRRAAALVLPFAERFRDAYAQKGFVTFDGLLVKARNLVRDHPDARRALKRRFRALLIDEFQDTDPLQGELLLYLAESPDSSAADWRNPAFRLEKGKALVVGDPKQSIYRFRGADMRAYETFTRLLLGQGALKCDLQTNFRSHEGLVAPVNDVFARVMKAKEGLQPDYLPLHPRPADGRPAPSPALSWVLTPADRSVKSRDGHRLEARWIAAWILKNCGEGKPHALKDVALLLRTSSPLAAYLDIFKETGIRYVVESDKYFYGAQEVIDFVNLLRVLDSPGDGISLLGLLRSPLAALDDAEARAVLAAGADYRRGPVPAEGLSPGGRKRLAAVFAMLRRLRAWAGREPLGDFVRRVLRDSFFLELSAVAYHDEQTVSNLSKFGRMAAEAGDGRGATLKEFIAAVLKSMTTVKEGESPLADEWLDAVRILTVHKAKGLEYPVVVLPNMTGVPGGGDERPAFRLDWESGRAGLRLPGAKAADLAMALIERAESEREEEEYVRLLYVAMTRAKERVILLGRAEAKGDGSFAGLLLAAGAWPAKGEHPAEISAGGRTFPVTYLQAAEEDRRAGGGKRGSPRVLPLKELAAAWSRRLAPREADPLFETPTGYLKEAPKPAAHAEVPADASPAALVGQVCHGVLQRWDFRAGGDLAAALDRQRRTLAPLHPLAASDWPEVIRLAREILEGFLGSAAARELAGVEILGTEVPFVFGREGRVVRGSLDLLYRKDGRLTVADYKTDKIAAPDRYVLQGRLYREAVKKAMGEDCAFKLIYLRTGETMEV